MTHQYWGAVLTNGQRADALVVGGGPAGLVAAETIASHGHSTILVEREQEIGSPVHTSGGIALKTMRDFRIPESLYHPVSRWRICSPNEQAIFDYEEPIACIIDVRRVYQFLAERASEAGVAIFKGVRAESPLFDRNQVVGCRVVDGDGRELEIHSGITIDASGYRSTISKQASLHQGFRRFGVGSEYELFAPNCSQREAVLIVGNQYAPSGYAWIFPWGAGRVRVGVGILHADARANPREHLKALVDNSKAFDVDLTGARIDEYHYGLVPADGVLSRLVADGIIAVGDAAGQASLVVGEGIRLGIVAGKLAGQTAGRALVANRFDREVLLSYERSFRSKYGRNLAIGQLLNSRMARYDDEKWDDRVRMLREMPPALLPRLLQSEFPFSEIALWMAQKPHLWGRALRWGGKGLVGYLHRNRQP